MGDLKEDQENTWKKSESKTSSKNTPNSLATQSISTARKKRTRKFLMMRPKKKRKKTTKTTTINQKSKKSTKTTKRLKRRKRPKPSRLNTSKKKNSTKPNHFGPEMSTTSPKRNTPSSTNHSPTIGKTIWPSNTSPSKVSLSSELYCLFQNELHSICSRTKKPKTPSNSTSDESSSWTTATS